MPLRLSIEFMVTKIVWKQEPDKLPKHQFALAAFPGVGNVGKLLVDGVVEGLDSTLLANIYHPDMPPQAKIVDGILTPPHLSIHSVNLVDQHILVIGGEGQPLSTTGQYEVAETILDNATKLGCEYTLVLAGLASEPTCEDVFAICADMELKEIIEKEGGEVSADKPAGGVIGLAGLIASMGPVHGISSGCIVAATIGSSVDTLAAERMRVSLQDWLGVKIPIPIATTEQIADKIEKLMDDYPDAQFPLELEDDNASSLYA